MLVCSSNYTQSKAQSVLHFIFHKDQKNPQLMNGTQSVKADTHRFVRVGEHLTSFTFVKSFPCIVLHPVSIQYHQEYLDMMHRYKYHEWLQDYATMPGKVLMAVNNAVNFLSVTPVMIGKSIGDKMETKTQTFINGLGLLVNSFDVNYDPLSKDRIFKRNIEEYSKRHTVYLLDPMVSISSPDLRSFKTKFGSMYRAENGVITKLTEMEEPVSDLAKERVQKRELGKMKLIYDEPDTKEEKEAAEAGQSKVVT